MAVFSVKISKDLKEKMNKFKNRVNWAEEVRRFIEERVRELEAEENFREVLSKLERATWSVPKGFSVEAVREDRDSN
uniref:CopG family transcriptional regulator n=1 Tax=Ignisphaera aggregans TaxID=334771 RepID=A0A7J3Z7W0_9CREN